MAQRERKSRPASSVPSLVKDLVDQFDQPLDFYRELIQNAIDAGSNRIDVSLVHDGTTAVIKVEDDGEGMDEHIIDEYLLVLFRSSKEDDFTKIGKFGIGFVSVFAPRPQLVRVYTSKGNESWRLDFPSYRRYEKYRLSELREGTLVELTKKMTAHEFEKLVRDSRETIRYWCKHSEARIFFSQPGSSAGPELLTEPFGLKDAAFAHNEEGTLVEVGFSPDEKPFYGFYNRGLTLKEGNELHFPGVEFKAKSRYLEHTLTRDNVMVDENYNKLMAILKRIVEEELPERLKGELTELAGRIAKAANSAAQEGEAGPEAAYAEPSGAWARRMPYLRWQFSGVLSGYLSRWLKRDWTVFPSLEGKPLSYELIQKSVSAGDGKLYYDSGPNRITRGLVARGEHVLPAGPWTECLSQWLGVEALKASSALIQPEVLTDQKLPASLRTFLTQLRWLDAQSGSKYGGIVAADFLYPGSPLKDKMFVTQKEPGELSAIDEKPVSSLFGFGRNRRWALIHFTHPATEKLSRLSAKRPGLAAFLCLKMMHLHDGEVPPDKETQYTNLAEKTEARLLQGALRLDAGGKKA